MIVPVELCAGLGLDGGEGAVGVLDSDSNRGDVFKLPRGEGDGVEPAGAGLDGAMEGILRGIGLSDYFSGGVVEMDEAVADEVGFLLGVPVDFHMCFVVGGFVGGEDAQALEQ